MARVNLITQAEYAKHRGVSEAAVSQAVSAGRISLIDGKIDAAVADIQWKSNTRARVSRSPSVQLPLDAKPQPGGQVLPPFAGNEETPKGDDYWESRGRREAAEAELAELKLAEQRGQLIQVEAVKTALANVFSTTRDALLQIPARLSPLLAAESDPASVQNMLHAEIHQALQHLAGASDRVGQVGQVELVVE